jgi:hypothetical protein
MVVREMRLLWCKDESPQLGFTTSMSDGSLVVVSVIGSDFTICCEFKLRQMTSLDRNVL